MESEKILNSLLSTDKEVVSQGLTSLKKSLDTNDGALMIANVKKLFKGFYNVLASHSYDPVLQCTEIVSILLK